MGQVQDKIAVVTGSARGIGQAVALKLASEGADIAVCDLQKDWCDETAGKVKELGRRAETYAMDVGNAESVQTAIDQVVKDFGRVDILVNNAGITKDGLMARMSEEDWDAVLDINLKGTFLCSKAAGRYMMKQRTGSIVNLASVIGLMGNAGQCNYAASKGGVIALTKSVAKELAGRNVRCNAVAPGFIQTKMTDKLTEEQSKAMLDATPLGRFGQPEDVANVITFLAGDQAAFVTGQVLSICGGLVM